jgi:hypothetical protein
VQVISSNSPRMNQPAVCDDVSKYGADCPGHMQVLHRQRAARYTVTGFIGIKYETGLLCYWTGSTGGFRMPGRAEIFLRRIRFRFEGTSAAIEIYSTLFMVGFKMSQKNRKCRQ